MASLADMVRQNKMQSIPQDKLLGGLSSGLGAVRNFGNKVNVPYLGGMGDMFLGKSPEEIENWSYGNSPFQSTEMGLPQIKRERKQSLVDALSALTPMAKMTEGLPVGMSIKAYHGSPVNFDKFDMSKIGSGEGAQAYGHGLYLAEHPKVAEEYRDRLSDFGSPYTYEWNGETFNQESGINPIKHALQSIYHQGKAKSLKMANSVMNDAINKDPYIMEMGGEDYANKLLSTIKSANKKDIKATQGQIYETSIQWPDAVREATDPLGAHHLIDYDAPFNQQPESIQKLLQSTYDDVYKQRSATRQRLNEKFANNNKVSPVNKEMSPITGQQIYKRLAGDLGSTTEASKKLNEMGIPGIKYLDKGSRKASGTSNYVMFGDEYPQITNRAGSLAQLLRGK